MNELNYMPEVEIDENGEPIIEAISATFRRNYPWENKHEDCGPAVMENYYRSKGLPMPKGVTARAIEQVKTRCGKLVWPKNIEAHEAHCPACAPMTEEGE